MTLPPNAELHFTEHDDDTWQVSAYERAAGSPPVLVLVGELGPYPTLWEALGAACMEWGRAR